MGLSGPGEVIFPGAGVEISRMESQEAALGGGVPLETKGRGQGPTWAGSRPTESTTLVLPTFDAPPATSLPALCFSPTDPNSCAIKPCVSFRTQPGSERGCLPMALPVHIGLENHIYAQGLSRASHVQRALRAVPHGSSGNQQVQTAAFSIFTSKRPRPREDGGPTRGHPAISDCLVLSFIFLCPVRLEGPRAVAFLSWFMAGPSGFLA